MLCDNTIKISQIWTGRNRLRKKPVTANDTKNALQFFILFFQVYFHTYIWVLIYWLHIEIQSEICIFNTILFVPKWATPTLKMRILRHTYTFMLPHGCMTSSKQKLYECSWNLLHHQDSKSIPPESCWNHSYRFRRKGRTALFRLLMGYNFAYHMKKPKPRKDALVFNDSLKLSLCSVVSALPVESISTTITGFCSFTANLPHRFINVTLTAVLAITTLISSGWYTLKALADYLSLKESFSILIKLACSQQKSTNAYHEEDAPGLDSAL